MRIVQFRSGPETGCGVEHDGQVFATGYADTLSLIRDAQLGLERAAAAPGQGDPVAVDRILAPLTNPGKMFGSGVNYRSHGDEEPGFTFPDQVPWDFIKVASAIIGPGDDIVIPPADDVIKRAAGGGKQFDEYGFAVDYEVEFGVVIGKRAKNVAAENALDHIFGYTVFNDVGSRSVQFHNGQRDLGKNFDTFCPMGPCIVTARRAAQLGRTSGSSRSSTASSANPRSWASRSDRPRWESSGSARSSRSSRATA